MKQILFTLLFIVTATTCAVMLFLSASQAGRHHNQDLEFIYNLNSRANCNYV